MSLATVHFAPITVVAHRDKANSFRRSSILFRPHVPPTRDFGGAAGYRPRVRSAYYLRVYVHSPGEPERLEYRAGAACTQERGTPFPSWPAVRANSPLGIFRHGRIRRGRNAARRASFSVVQIPMWAVPQAKCPVSGAGRCKQGAGSEAGLDLFEFLQLTFTLLGVVRGLGQDRGIHGRESLLDRRLVLDRVHGHG